MCVGVCVFEYTVWGLLLYVVLQYAKYRDAAHSNIGNAHSLQTHRQTQLNIMKLILSAYLFYMFLHEGIFFATSCNFKGILVFAEAYFPGLWSNTLALVIQCGKAIP